MSLCGDLITFRVDATFINSTRLSQSIKCPTGYLILSWNKYSCVNISSLVTYCAWCAASTSENAQSTKLFVKLTSSSPLQSNLMKMSKYSFPSTYYWTLVSPFIKMIILYMMTHDSQIIIITSCTSTAFRTSKLYIFSVGQNITSLSFQISSCLVL